MKIKGLLLEQIEACARAAGHFKLDNVRTEGNYVLFVLRMASGTPTVRERKWLANREEMAETEARANELAERMTYRKRGFGRMAFGRGPEFGIAVCFHGHEAFMRECFRVNPDTVIRTAKACYLGLADFEQKFTLVGMQNVGSLACPIQYREACDCYGG